MKKWAFLEKAKLPQKKFLWGIIGISIAILIYAYGITPLVEVQKKADEEIALKQQILKKYADVLQNRRTVEEALGQTLKQNEEIQKRFLTGETLQLGAANLQDIVKRVCDKYGISLRSFRILEPKEIKELSAYRKTSLQIEFNPINSMQSLSQFINDLEHQEQELMISEMDLLVFNPRLPTNIQGNLVVTGLMKVSKAQEKEK